MDPEIPSMAFSNSNLTRNSYHKNKSPSATHNQVQFFSDNVPKGFHVKSFNESLNEGKVRFSGFEVLHQPPTPLFRYILAPLSYILM